MVGAEHRPCEVGVRGSRARTTACAGAGATAPRGGCIGGHTRHRAGMRTFLAWLCFYALNGSLVQTTGAAQAGGTLGVYHHRLPFDAECHFGIGAAQAHEVVAYADWASCGQVGAAHDEGEAGAVRRRLCRSRSPLPWCRCSAGAGRGRTACGTVCPVGRRISAIPHAGSQEADGMDGASSRLAGRGCAATDPVVYLQAAQYPSGGCPARRTRPPWSPGGDGRTRCVATQHSHWTRTDEAGEAASSLARCQADRSGRREEAKGSTSLLPLRKQSRVGRRSSIRRSTRRT